MTTENQTNMSDDKKSEEPARRGPGRPQELADPVTTTIRIEREDLEHLDRWAAQQALSRSQAVAVAVRMLSCTPPAAGTRR